MIHTDDEYALGRMLGITEFPADLIKEYELRLRMFHANGHSGPLGTIALISVVRELGYGPPYVEEKPVSSDWRKYPYDGSVRVEARFFGGWQLGVFLGFVEAGTVAVKLDNDETVRECRPDMVRLAAADAPPPPPTKAEAAASAAEAAKLSANEPKDAATDEPDEIIELDDAPAAAVTGQWVDVKAGAKVWVERGSDILDGEFVACVSDTVPPVIQVLVDGRSVAENFAAADVQLVT